MMCAAKLKLNVPDMKRDMCIALYSYPTMVEHMSKTASEYNMMVYVTLCHTCVHMEYIYFL